jgi:hypothetical protein
MLTSTTRNPGYVSRRGDDRRITHILPDVPGRWDVYWADGASVSVLAPSEDVARLRAQLRRDQSERALDQAVTTFVPGAPAKEAGAAKDVLDAPTPTITLPTPTPTGARARALADAVAIELVPGLPPTFARGEVTLPPRPEAGSGERLVPPPGDRGASPGQGGPSARASGGRGARHTPRRPSIAASWVAAVAVGATAALLVGGLAVLGAVLALGGAA